jgi:hypothetical protein
MRPSLCCTALLLFLITFGLSEIGKSQDAKATQVFDVSELYQRLKNEAGLSEEQCRLWIEDRVKPLIAQAVASFVEIQGEKATQESSFWGVKTVDEELHVVAPKETQKKVRELVDTFTQFGVRQVKIRALVYRDTEAAMKAMPIQWSHVEAASSVAESPGSNVVRPASHTQPLSAVGKFIESQKPQVKEDIPPPEGVTDATWMEASSIVERSTPVLYSLLSPEQHAAVIAHTRKQSSLQRLMSPSVMVFNGQIASMSNAVQRQFVTGIKVMKLGPESKQRVEFAPSTKEYQEGTTMKLRPELMGRKSIRLNCQLDICNIRSVEKQTIPGVKGRGDFTVQMPEVAVTKFRTCLDMPVGYTLAISAFETDEAGVKHSTVVLCTCELFNIEK